MTSTRITLDDWISAKAPLDHAPSRAYVRRDGRWFIECDPITQARVEAMGLNLDVGDMTASWCEHVAKTIKESP